MPVLPSIRLRHKISPCGRNVKAKWGIAANPVVEPDDFKYVPFAQEGGLGKVHQLFGTELNQIVEELNGALAA